MTVRAFRFLEDHTGLSLSRLCCVQRAGAGVAILVGGLVIQAARLV